MNNPYLRLVRLDKPVGIYLLLYPTLWALWLATMGTPSTKLLIIFILGVVLIRSAGCVINDIADRKFDRHIVRTQARPITAGEVSVPSALILFFILLIVAFLLVLQTNQLTVLLAFIALGLASLYPWMKRWTYLPQFILGLAFSMSILMAFAAVQNVLPTQAWLLVLTNIIWTISYDTMYAMADREEDLKIGVKSTAILWGRYDLLVLSVLQAVVLILLIVVGYVFVLATIYFWFLLPVAMAMLYYQWLIKDRDAKRCFRAFLYNHYLGLFVLAGIVLNYF